MERSSLRRELLRRAAPGIALLALGGLLLTWTAARAVAERDAELRDSRLSRVMDAFEAADRSLRTLVVDLALSEAVAELAARPAGGHALPQPRLEARPGVDFLAVLDGSQRVVYVSDPTGSWARGQSVAGVAEVVRARRLPAAPFVWATRRGEVWLAGAPIGGRGAAAGGGSVLAGYVLTPRFVARLGRAAGVPLRLVRPAEPPPEGGGAVVLRTLDDAGGHPVAALVAAPPMLPGGLLGGGYWALAAYFFTSLLAGLLLLALAAERSLVGPLLALRRGVEELRSSGRLSLALPSARQDEIGQLASGVAALAAELRDSEFSRHRSEGQLYALLDATPDDITVLDRGGRVLGLKRSVSDASLVPHGAGIGDALPALFGEALAAEVAPRVGRALETGEAEIFEWDAGEGRERRTWECRIVPAGASEVVAIWRDVTPRRRAEKARERLSAIVDATPDLVATAHPDGRLRYVNPAARRVLGLSDACDVSAHRLADFVPPEQSRVLAEEAVPAALRDGAWSGELSLAGTASDEAVPVSVVLLAHREPGAEPGFLSVIARDISDRKRFEARLLHLADHDPLTDLLARRRFIEELTRELAQGRRYGEEGALAFLDLDDFKFVNDSLGHAAGDELLIGISRLLQSRLRRTDSLARLGGDEFAVLLPRAGRRQAEQVVAGLLEAMRRESLRVGGREVGVTASAGIVLFPEHGSDPAELLARADLAMYQAKSRGRNLCCVFETDQDWQERVASRVHGEQRIRDALEAERFVLYAQPLLDLHTWKIEEFELLLRMRNEDGRVVRPGAFLGVAERFGLIHEIDRWVVREAIRLLGAERSAGRLVRVSVNLAGRAFEDRELPGLIRTELAARGLLASALALEVTESAAIADTARVETFAASLKELGCRFALDDFGVGFSSLYHLKNLPVDVLKIDGSFVRDLARNPVDMHLVRAIVEVGKALRKETVAEYVADEATLQLLVQCGVDYAQGYHVGKPAPAEEAFGLFGTSRPANS